MWFSSHLTNNIIATYRRIQLKIEQKHAPALPSNYLELMMNKPVRYFMLMALDMLRYVAENAYIALTVCVLCVGDFGFGQMNTEMQICYVRVRVVICVNM